MTATSEALLRASLHAESQDHVITLTEARRCGLKDADVRALLQAGAWKRLHREVFFVNADLFGEIPRRTVLRAALKRYGDQAVLWGASAAEVYGIQGAPPDERVWVLLPIGQECPQSPSVRLRFREACQAETCVLDGFPVTILCRTVADACTDLDRFSSLSMLDSALHLGLLTPAQLAQVALLAAGRRGAVQLRELLDIADARAASPLESRVRLHAYDANVPPDQLQWPVQDRNGIVVGYADMAWLRPGKRPLIAEADGEGPHGRPRAITHDRHRQNDFVGADVDILRFTWVDSIRRGYIGATLRRSLFA